MLILWRLYGSLKRPLVMIPLDTFYIGFGSLGGDPAADSPTATLLRLNPPHGT